MTIGDICEIKTNFPDADFWLQRKGDKTTVGKPTKEYYEENIGIKVRDDFKDKVDSGYLYYYFVFLHQKGVFGPISHGTLKLQNIRLSDIKSIPVMLSENGGDLLNEIKDTEHFLERLKKRINITNKYLVKRYFKNNGKFDKRDIGTYELTEDEVNTITKRIEKMATIDVDDKISLGVETYSFNIIPERIVFLNNETKERILRDILRKDNDAVLVLAEPSTLNDKNVSIGDTIYTIIRENKFITIFFKKSAEKEKLIELLEVDDVVTYEEVKKFKPVEKDMFKQLNVTIEPTPIVKPVNKKPFISGDFIVPSKIAGGKIYIYSNFVEKYNQKQKSAMDKIKFDKDDKIRYNDKIYVLMTNSDKFDIGKNTGGGLSRMEESFGLLDIFKETLVEEFNKKKRL